MYMDPDARQSLNICCASVGAFFFIMILIFSWDTVEPTEWGLKYNSLTKQVDGANSILYIKIFPHTILSLPRWKILLIPFQELYYISSNPREY